MTANQSSDMLRAADLPDDVRDTVEATTTRFVNHSIDKRIERVVSVDRQTQAIGERFWRPAMVLLVTILVVAFGWLVVGALR